jgi:hypothetical protein
MLASGCATAVPPSPPEARTPTPVTVTKENPAGDAKEPEDAALTRLLKEPIGNRFDRFHTLMLAVPDVGNWRRVRIFGHPTRVTYRYGDKHYAIDMVDYRAADGGQDSPDACLARFVARASEEAERYSVNVGPIERGVSNYRPGPEANHLLGERDAAPAPLFDAARQSGTQRVAAQAQAPEDRMLPMPYVRVAGSFATLFNRDRYLGVVAAYRSWPGTCLVHAFAARVGTDEALARKVIDRWVADLAPRLEWTARVTSAPPFEDR